MKPNPFASLNHFTVPVCMCSCLLPAGRPHGGISLLAGVVREFRRGNRIASTCDQIFCPRSSSDAQTRCTYIGPMSSKIILGHFGVIFAVIFAVIFVVIF